MSGALKWSPVPGRIVWLGMVGFCSDVSIDCTVGIELWHHECNTWQPKGLKHCWGHVCVGCT